MTQNEEVLKHMRLFGCITSGRAMADYGIARLAARIEELKKEGHDIDTETIRGTSRTGKPVHFAQYRLKGGGELFERKQEAW